MLNSIYQLKVVTRTGRAGQSRIYILTKNQLKDVWSSFNCCKEAVVVLRLIQIRNSNTQRETWQVSRDS